MNLAPKSCPSDVETFSILIATPNDDEVLHEYFTIPNPATFCTWSCTFLELSNVNVYTRDNRVSNVQKRRNITDLDTAEKRKFVEKPNVTFDGRRKLWLWRDRARYFYYLIFFLCYALFWFQSALFIQKLNEILSLKKENLYFKFLTFSNHPGKCSQSFPPVTCYKEKEKEKKKKQPKRKIKGDTFRLMWVKQNYFHGHI